MTQALFTAFASGGGNKQLVARNCAINTRPITIDNAINAPVKRGALVYGATPDAVFLAPVHTTGQPAATDLIFIMADDIDLTGAAADVKCNVFITGEFVEETVWAACDATLSAAEKLAIKELLIRQGINLVSAAYGGNTETPV